MRIPRVLVAGLRGGGGKTLVSAGLLAAFRKRGLSAAPFKKGPDYIDAAWLTTAAGEACRNLDLFLMEPGSVLASFGTAAGRDVAVIEGNRGLFDGMDARGTYSTAELAKLLRVPVLLAVDCTKATRTVAALVLGCRSLDPDVPFRGVILNRTGGKRHEEIVRRAVEDVCGLPVLGVIPRLREDPFPERHLGLVPPAEHDRRRDAVARAGEIVERSLDLEAILEVASSAPELDLPVPSVSGEEPGNRRRAEVRIGVLRDAAFQFYYPENLEALVREGASIVEVSPLRQACLPPVDALYIGGGFPETAASRLAENRSFARSLREAAAGGLPVYAECGGAVYLGRSLVLRDREYPMSGVFPVTFHFREKPQGHGYTVLETVGENPFYEIGESLKGHEFHYTYVPEAETENLEFTFRVRRGYGFDGRKDGLRRGNVLASYTHIHAAGVRTWAPALVRAASRYRASGGSMPFA